jgi:hypothetical protein
MKNLASVLRGPFERSEKASPTRPEKHLVRKTRSYEMSVKNPADPLDSLKRAKRAAWDFQRRSLAALDWARKTDARFFIDIP